MSRHDLYRVIPFPEPGFEVDEPAQSAIRDDARRKGRNLQWLFICMVASFVLAIGLGFMHLIAATLIFLATFVLSFILLVFALVLPGLRLQKQPCGRCGGPLETVWAGIPPSASAEYQICRRCKLFRYMFRTTRR